MPDLIEPPASVMALSRLQPVDPTTMQERVYRQLRTTLMAGAFGPGEAVTLRGIAEAMGTSLMPVREAVRRLVSERALEMPTSRSLRVPLLSLQGFEDLCALRVLLEPEATALATARMTDVDIDEIAAANARLLACFAAGDMDGTLAANHAFHSGIYARCGNERLAAMIEGLWLQSGPYLTLLHGVPRADLNARLMEHEAVVAALRSRDAPAARALVESLIRETAGLYRSRIRDEGALADKAGTRRKVKP